MTQVKVESKAKQAVADTSQHFPVKISVTTERTYCLVLFFKETPKIVEKKKKKNGAKILLRTIYIVYIYDICLCIHIKPIPSNSYE